jgi:hypothetical protein
MIRACLREEAAESRFPLQVPRKEQRGSFPLQSLTRITLIFPELLLNFD